MMMFYSFLWLNCATTSLVLHTETADVRKPCFKNHKCSCDEATPLVKNASIKQIFTCEEHAGPFCLAEAKLTNRYQTLTLNNLHERSEFSILHYFFFKFWFCSIFKIRKKNNNPADSMYVVTILQLLLQRNRFSPSFVYVHFTS